MNILLTTLNSKFIHTNLAIKYLANSIKDKMCDLEDIDVIKKEFTINNSEEYIYNEIIAGKHDIACFSCYIWNIDKTLHLCRLLKKAKPEMTILLGGPEVSYDGEKILEENPYIDIIICGEGEVVLPEILRSIYNEGLAPQKLYREMPITTDDMTFPYRDEEVEANKIIYYEASRGCPYNCSYCMSSIEKRVRGLPIERVKDELKFFLDRNVKQVKFLDRTFNWHKERSYELFKFLIDNDNGKTNFHFEICAENVTDETIELIGTARPGLFQFEIGIQSTNEKTLKAVDRLSNVELLLSKTRKIIALNNAHIHVDLIAGLPYEDIERFKKSFDDVYSLKADALQLGFLKLLKGTKIRDEEAKHDYVYDDKAPYQIIKNSFIYPEDMVRLKRIEHVLDDYYNKGGFEKSLDKLVEKYGSAFAFYDAFADFYHSEGYQHMSHKKEDNYRILNKFAVEVLNDNSITDTIYEDLVNRMNEDAVKKFNRKGWEV